MKITRAVALAGAVLVLAGCSSINTNSDQAGLHYSGGSMSDTKFGECVKPGTQEYYGPGDLNYVYPYGERTYEFQDGDAAEQGPISVADKDGNLLRFSGILSFRLNTDCKVLQEFHEAIGLKYGAGDDGVSEWTELLNNYLGTTLESAMNDSGNAYSWQQLYSDASKRAEFVETVKKNLPDYVENLAKGPYFQNFTLTVQRPVPDQRLTDQIASQAENAERINTAATEKDALAAEQAQIQQLVQIFGGWEGYIAYRNQLNCEENAEACIPFLPIPQGSAINVTPGG